MHSSAMTGMRAHEYSIFFGFLALCGLPFNPPITGCFSNPFFYFFAGCAGLGLVLGLIGLLKGDRGPAIAGILFSVASPFAARAMAPRWGYNTEGNTIGDIRTVISAQEAYKSQNDGYHGTLECLSHPSACIPGYPQTAPTFIDSTLASGQPRSGYERHFIAGPAARRGRPLSSMRSYAYVAIPIEPGVSGIRGFCGDSEGVICSTAKGQMPQVKDGRCVTDAQDPEVVCRFLR